MIESASLLPPKVDNSSAAGALACTRNKTDPRHFGRKVSFLQMKTKEKGNMATEEPVNWNVEMEVNLFHAMRKHKPVGVNRHFQMLYIHDKLSSAVGRKISAKQIWSHLASMYDLQALQESEILPFPNKTHEFALPESDFSEELRRARSELLPSSVSATPPSSKEKETREGKEVKDSKQDKIEKTDKADKTEKAEKMDKAEKAERVEPEPKGGKGKSGGKDKGTVPQSKTGGKSGSSTKSTPTPATPVTPASASTDSSRKRKRTRNTPNQDTPTKRRR